MNFLFTMVQYIGVCIFLWVAYFMLPLGKVSKGIKRYIKYGVYVASSLILVFGVWQASTTYGYRHTLDIPIQQQYTPEISQIENSQGGLVEEVDRIGSFDDKIETKAP